VLMWEVWPLVGWTGEVECNMSVGVIRRALDSNLLKNVTSTVTLYAVSGMWRCPDEVFITSLSVISTYASEQQVQLHILVVNSGSEGDAEVYVNCGSLAEAMEGVQLAGHGNTTFALVVALGEAAAGGGDVECAVTVRANATEPCWSEAGKTATAQVVVAVPAPCAAEPLLEGLSVNATWRGADAAVAIAGLVTNAGAPANATVAVVCGAAAEATAGVQLAGHGNTTFALVVALGEAAAGGGDVECAVTVRANATESCLPSFTHVLHAFTSLSCIMPPLSSICEYDFPTSRLCCNISSPFPYATNVTVSLTNYSAQDIVIHPLSTALVCYVVEEIPFSAHLRLMTRNMTCGSSAMVVAVNSTCPQPFLAFPPHSWKSLYPSNSTFGMDVNPLGLKFLPCNSPSWDCVRISMTAWNFGSSPADGSLHLSCPAYEMYFPLLVDAERYLSFSTELRVSSAFNCSLNATVRRESCATALGKSIMQTFEVHPWPNATLSGSFIRTV